jgi:Lon protease-like protein
MVDDAMSGERIIGMVQTRPGGDRTRPRLQRVGCAGRITSFAETSDGRYLITLTGVARFQVGEELPTPSPYRQVKAGFAAYEDDLQPASDTWDFDRDRLLGALRTYLHQRSMDVDWSTAQGAPGEALINSLAMALPFEAQEKQALLEAETLEQRTDVLTALLEIEAALGGETDEPQPMQ